MKSTIFPVSLLFCMVSLFIGCENPEENELPKYSNLKVDGKEVITNAVASRAKEVVISFSVSDDDKVKSVSVSETGKTEKVYTNPSVNQETALISFPYIVTQTATLVITITDSDNKSITSNLLITLVQNNAPIISNLKVNGTALTENSFSGESQLLTLSFSVSDDDGLYAVTVSENGSGTPFFAQILNDSLSVDVSLTYQLIKTGSLRVMVTDNQNTSVTTTLSIVLIKPNEPPVMSNLKVEGVEVTNETPSLLPGEKLISFTVSDDSKIKSVSISESGAPTPVFFLNEFTKPSENISFYYNVTKAIELIFTVTDDDDKSMTRILKVNFEPSIKLYSLNLMGAQLNPTLGSFFATSTGTVFLQSAAKANASIVDFVYFYGITNQATLAAPNDENAATIFNNSSSGLQTWVVRNATSFKLTTLTHTDFGNVISSTKPEEIYQSASGLPSSKVTQLTSGAVVAFKTAFGKYGLVYISSIGTGTAGSITLDVKVGK